MRLPDRNPPTTEKGNHCLFHSLECTYCYLHYTIAEKDAIKILTIACNFQMMEQQLYAADSHSYAANCQNMTR